MKESRKARNCWLRGVDLNRNPVMITRNLLILIDARTAKNARFATLQDTDRTPPSVRTRTGHERLSPSQQRGGHGVSLRCTPCTRNALRPQNLDGFPRPERSLFSVSTSCKWNTTFLVLRFSCVVSFRDCTLRVTRVFTAFDHPLPDRSSQSMRQSLSHRPGDLALLGIGKSPTGRMLSQPLTSHKSRLRCTSL